MSEAQIRAYKDRTLIAIIGDEHTVTGFLLAGVGHMDIKKESNFLTETSLETLEENFDNFTKRKDIAIILINQHVADDIRQLIDCYQSAFPAVLEIPSKDHPYDPSKDSVLKRVKRLFG